MIVVDFRHWLLVDGRLSPHARLAPHVAAIVECATAGLGEGMTAMVCRYRGSRQRCMGRIGVVSKEGTIEWCCDACGEAGLVSGWTGTRWDLSEVDLAPEDEEHGLYFELGELRALRELDLDPVLRAALAGALVVEQMHACVPLTEAELIRLMHAVTNATASGRTRRSLDRALGRIEQVRVAHQLARRAAAH